MGRYPMSRVFFSIMFATGLAVGVAAQPAQQTAAAQGDTAKLTGCLAPLAQNDNAMGATTNASARTPKESDSSERFALFNPSMGPAASTSGGSVQPSADQKVLLVGQNFKQIQGHTVEVSGNFLGKDAAETTGSTAGTTGTTANTAGERHLRTFRVTSVDNVGAACSISGR